MPDCNATITETTIDPTRVKGAGFPDSFADQALSDAISFPIERPKGPKPARSARPPRTGKSPKVKAIVDALRKHCDPDHPAVKAAIDAHTAKSIVWLFGDMAAVPVDLDPAWVAIRQRLINDVAEYEGYTVYSDLDAYDIEHPDGERLYAESGARADTALYDALHYPVQDHATLTDKASLLETLDLYDDGAVKRGVAADLRRLQAAIPPVNQDILIVQACNVFTAAQIKANALDDGALELKETLAAEEAALRVVLSETATTYKGVRASAEALKGYLERQAGPGGIILEDLGDRWAWKVASDLLSLSNPVIPKHSALHADPVVSLMAEYEQAYPAAEAEDESPARGKGPANQRLRQLELEMEQAGPTTAQGVLYQLAMASARVDMHQGAGAEGGRDLFDRDCKTIFALISQSMRMLVRNGAVHTPMVEHFSGPDLAKGSSFPIGEPATPLREIVSRIQALAKDHVALEEVLPRGGDNPSAAAAVQSRMRGVYAQIEALEEEASWTQAYTMEDVFRSLVFIYNEANTIEGLEGGGATEISANRIHRHLFNCVRQLERHTDRPRSDFTWWDILDTKFDQVISMDKALYPAKYAAGLGMPR